MPRDVHILEGHLLADRYRVERVLGEGGMGQVLLAYHVDLAQRVAVKLLQPGLALRDPTATERFKREARTSARIRHENVCRVLDAGTLADGTPYLAMEYLEGRDLGEELTERGRLSVGEAVSFVRQACEGVHEAHRLGIVHRDLKPQNLFLARTDEGVLSVKVLDFGISKARVDDLPGAAQLTRTSSLVGSPLYMSPEQLHADKTLDARADLWGLGCILYELISGRPPFVGETIPQLVHAVLHLEPPSLLSLGITVPGGLEAVVTRALHKNREARFASAREFGEALLPYAPRPDTAASGARARTPVPYHAPGDAARASSSEAGAPSGSGGHGATPAPKGTPTPGTGNLTGRPAAESAVLAATPARAIRARQALGWAALGFVAVLGALGVAIFSRQRAAQPTDEANGMPAGHNDGGTAADLIRVPALPSAPAVVAPSSVPITDAGALAENAAEAPAPEAAPTAVQALGTPDAPSAIGTRTPTPHTWRARTAGQAASATAAGPTPSADAPPPANNASNSDKPRSSSGLPSFGGRR